MVLMITWEKGWIQILSLHFNNETIMYKTSIGGFTKTTEYSPKGGLQLSEYISVWYNTDLQKPHLSSAMMCFREEWWRSPYQFNTDICVYPLFVCLHQSMSPPTYFLAENVSLILHTLLNKQSFFLNFM